MFRKAMCLFGLMMPVLIIAFLGLLSGCGTGGLADAPAEPPPPTTDLSVEVAASPTSVSAGQTSIITATVTGDNNSGATVEFSFPVNSSGASFINSSGSSVSSITVTASGSGIATAIYQAGSTSSGTEVQDTVQAVMTNGANGAAIITRTTTTIEAYAVSIGASTTSVTAGQVSVITATVTSGSTPASGVTVTFTLPINNSGALLSPTTATTDGAGKAVVIYQPGTISPTLTVYDTVQAAVGTATSAVVITRSGSATTTEAYALSIGASTTTVTAGEVSTITATVTSGSTPAGGVTVIFSLPINSSSATLSSFTAPTDGTGKAVVFYQSGITSPTLTVYDTVQAAVGTATSTLAITRSGSSSATYAVSIGTSTTSVTAGQVSIITATVTSGSTPAGGVTVIFSLPINSSSATLSAPTATTDGSGNAVVVYQPGTTSPTLTVQDMVQAAVGTATSAKAITRVGGSATQAYSITVRALPLTLTTSTSNSVITATVTNNLGAVISGVPVSFAVTGVVNPGVGTLSVASAITDGSGNAVTTFTGNGAGTGATSVVTASITVDGNTYTDAALITYP